MDIKEAAIKLREGYKLRRPNWVNESFSLHLDETGLIVNQYGDRENELDANDLLAENWEIAE